MSNPSQEQIELQSTIEAQGVLNKQFARLIVEQVTSVTAGNLNAILKVIEQQGADRQTETERLTALIGGLSADLGKLSAGQGILATRISNVEEEVNQLNTRHGGQWEAMNRALDELRHSGTELSQANTRAITVLSEGLARLQAWADTMQQRIDQATQ